MGKVWKDGDIIENPWTAADANNEGVPSRGVGTLDQWRADPTLTAVEIKSDEDVSDLTQSLDQLRLVVLKIEDFNDGRSFSQARHLREAGFTGELRAAGNFLQDQVQYLQRCGVDAFELSADIKISAMEAALSEFSVSYQMPLDERSAEISLAR
ncbi:conserved hypothetical protein [Luminiphilus syltensis NOR5-1B]|uniref:DUF934 domain-containing protein n=1 Tax=Luminiphilus syltensis NOR5-1B TaxID=565045 RepID=B8KQY0_9GAMM|nr:DUF934 domain-containing protein [Luminiphilus syltensis]EED35373.1 conserved hypothetical protein [Luminiphilus syltensis NOR5-1B]